MANIRLVIFFIFVCIQLQGQYRFTSLGTGDGLPHDKIIAIRQDESGFIWIGTRDGIARYDGRDLKVIRPEQAQETSRVDNHIVSIFPSRNGDTWFSTFQPGIYRYSLAEDKIEYYPMNAEGKVRARDRIIAMDEDSNGNLWMGTIGEMLKFDPKGGRFQRIKGHMHVNAILVNEDSTLWIYEPGKGVLLMNFQGEILKHYPMPEVSGQFYYRNGTIVGDELNILWAGAEKSLFRIDPSSDSAEKIAGFNSPVMNLVTRKNGEIWIATAQHGLYIYNRYSEEIKKVEARLNDSDWLSETPLQDIYMDRSGVVYLASARGVHVMDWSRQFFHFFPAESRIDEFQVVNFGGRLLEPAGNTVYRVNLLENGSEIIQTRFKDLEFKKKVKEKQVAFFDHKDLSAIVSVEEGYFAGTLKHGLWFCKSGSSSPENIPIPEALFDPEKHQINDMVIDLRENIWLACSHGLLKVPASLRPGDYLFLSGMDGVGKVLSGGRCKALLLDSQGWLWVGTLHSGISLIHTDTEEIRIYGRNPGKDHSLSNNSISCIYEDSRGMVWVGTNGGGINKFNRATNSFSNVSIADGLADNEICSILEDDGGKLWVSHLKGLSRFTPETGKIINYSNHDLGVKEAFIKRNAGKLEDGTLIFGSIKGSMVFDPSLVVENNVVPQLYIDQLFVNGIPHNRDQNNLKIERSVMGIRRLEIKQKPSSLSFDVHALSGVSQHKNRVRYSWNDSDWIRLEGEEYTVNLTQFRPGKNEVRITASNNDMMWSRPETLTIHISLLPRILLLTGIVLALSVGFLIHYRSSTRSNKKKINLRRLRNRHPEIDLDSLREEVEKIKKLLREEKPYLNPKLTLNELASMLDMPSSHLSHVINDVMQMNFNDLVNSYRVDYIIRLMNDPENRKLTLLSLAYEAGFNSKASFFRVFKKQTGQTPSEYHKGLSANK